MGKYIVTKDILNVRNQPKITDSTYVGSLNLGAVVELADDTVLGDTPIGTTDNTWRPDNLNRYLSNAGVAPLGSFAAKRAEFLADPFNIPYIDSSDPQDDTKWKVSWGHIDLEIWKIWKDFGTKGEGVKVVVIDDGAWQDNNDLKGRISASSKNVTDNSTLDSSNPIHGTCCAGIVGANGANCNVVYGVAPGCELIVIKAGSSGNFLAPDINNALSVAQELNADIVSLSRGLNSSDPVMASWIQDCVVNKNMLVCCGAGDLGTTDYYYPASDPDSFSIGAYLVDGTGLRQFNTKVSNYNDRVTFLAPGNQILTTSQTSSPAFFDATSAATAFAAGMFALVRGALKGKIVDAMVIQRALAASGNVDKISVTNEFNGSVVPGLYQLIQYLKNELK